MHSNRQRWELLSRHFGMNIAFNTKETVVNFKKNPWKIRWWRWVSVWWRWPDGIWASLRSGSSLPLPLTEAHALNLVDKDMKDLTEQCYEQRGELSSHSICSVKLGEMKSKWQDGALVRLFSACVKYPPCREEHLSMATWLPTAVQLQWTTCWMRASIPWLQRVSFYAVSPWRASCSYRE